MSCKIPPAVQNYIDLVKSGSPRACPEQHALVERIERIFSAEPLYVDVTKLPKYLSLAKYFPVGRLLPWEVFPTALWLCTYDA